RHVAARGRIRPRFRRERRHQPVDVACETFCIEAVTVPRPGLAYQGIGRRIARKRLVEATGDVEHPAEGKASSDAVIDLAVRGVDYQGEALDLRCVVRPFSCRRKMPNREKVGWIDLAQTFDARIGLVKSSKDAQRPSEP